MGDEDALAEDDVTDEALQSSMEVVGGTFDDIVEWLGVLRLVPAKSSQLWALCV